MRDRFTKLEVDLFARVDNAVAVLSKYSNDELLTLRSQEGESILHVACFKPNAFLKILLREFKARGILEEMMLMKDSTTGWTPLHCAIWHEDISNLDTILATAADNKLLTELLFSQDFNLNTALHTSFYYSQDAISAILIGAAYDDCILTALLSYKNDIGKTAIEYLKDDSPLHDLVTDYT